MQQALSKTNIGTMKKEEYNDISALLAFIVSGTAQ